MNVGGPPRRQPALGAGKRWIVRGQNTNRAAALARVLGISPIVAALLISRGYDDEPSARAFLQPSYDQLHEPFLMHLQQTPGPNAGIEMAYTIETNLWHDEMRMQLNVADLRVVSGSVVVFGFWSLVFGFSLRPGLIMEELKIRN